MRHLETLAILGLALGVASAQVVVDRMPCDAEHIKPNFEVDVETRVRGRLTDQTGAPFSRSRIKLRKYRTEQEQTGFLSADTDADGNFDLGTVQPGKFRLVAAPHRGFAQPERLRCVKHPDCMLNIVLKVNGTDLPFAHCPIR